MKPFLISTWYRPPSSTLDLFANFETILEKIEAENIESSIIGDFNCNVASNSPIQCTKILLELCDMYQYSQLINKSTRITPSTSTTIDLFLTNEPSKYRNAGVSHIGISDHSVIYAARKLVLPKTSIKYTKSRSYKRFVPELFVRDIDSVPWDNILQFNDPIVAWASWRDSFMKIVDLHAPTKTKRVRNSFAPWLTPEVKELMHGRDHLKKIAQITNQQEDWSAYKQAKNNLNRVIKQSKSDYYEQYFSQNKGNTCETWKGINSSI